MSTLDEATTGRSPGAVLAAERERQGISRADAAQRLRMSASQIEALESGDYARLPRGTFLRGFVRNYAKLLGVAPDPLLNTLAEDMPHHSRPGIVVASQNIRFEGQGLASPYWKATGAAIVAVAVAFATMYWWLFIRPAPPALAAAKKAAEAQATRVAANASPPIAAAPVAAAPVETPPPEARKAEPIAAEAPKIEAVPVDARKVEATPGTRLAPAMAEPARSSSAGPAVATAAAASAPIDPVPVIAAGGSVIRLRFRGSAWVEIKDGRGKVLLSRNNPGGSEAEVVGKGPFSVVVGNAPEVTMYLNNREFDLEPHTRVAVARFTVQ